MATEASLLPAEDWAVPRVEAPLWPQLLWHTQGKYNYDDDERAHGRHIQRTNHLILVVWVAVYLGFAWAGARLDGADGQEVPKQPLAVFAAQIAFTVVAVYTLHVDNFCTNMPLKEEPELYGVTQGPLGKWVFLTRHTIAFQAIHFVISLAAPLAGWYTLARGTYYLASFIAGLGAFVTIQFVMLVTPHPDYKRDCCLWAQRGMHLQTILFGMHMPQIVLAVVDMLLLKSRPVLLQDMPSFVGILAGYLSYVVFYLGLVHANRAITGQWPYGMMKELGNSPKKWLQFSLVQTCVVVFFGLALWILARETPGVW